MTSVETSRFVRLRIDLVLEITGPDELRRAALAGIDGDDSVPAEDRDHARVSVQEDDAEALAYLIDPLDLVSEVPGVDLAQASWTSEQIEYDPDAEECNFDAEEGVSMGED
jgi:hypothetical protein